MSAASKPIPGGSAGTPGSSTLLQSLPEGYTHPSVLIIEDHREVAESLRRVLEQMRVYAVVSPDGEAALKMAAAMRFSLVILDVLLPRMNGFEICRALRNLPNMRDVPVLFASCVTSPAAQAEGAALGAAHYLCKPFKLVEFQTQVERILIADAQRQARAQDGRFNRT